MGINLFMQSLSFICSLPMTFISVLLTVFLGIHWHKYHFLV